MDTSKPGAVSTALLQHLTGGQCLTLPQIADELGLSARQARDSAYVLLRRELLTKMGTGCYQLTEAGIAAAASGVRITPGSYDRRGKLKVHRNTFRERCWRSMRMNQRFTIGDVVSDAQTESDQLAYEHARRYISYLRAAGYVTELPRRAKSSTPFSNGFKRFVLTKDTGPKAPVYRREFKSIHDFNTGEDIPCKKG